MNYISIDFYDIAVGEKKTKTGLIENHRKCETPQLHSECFVTPLHNQRPPAFDQSDTKLTDKRG